MPSMLGTTPRPRRARRSARSHASLTPISGNRAAITDPVLASGLDRPRAGRALFHHQHGETCTPIRQNDAVNWPELNGLWRRRDLPAVARHLRWLADHGVTVLRLILEYVQDDRRYIENPVGHWNLPMVQLWDDLFALCVSAGLRILLRRRPKTNAPTCSV